MSLQSRLFAFFISIAVLPLGTAFFLTHRIIDRELKDRPRSLLGMANQAAIALYEERVLSTRDRVQLIAGDDEFGRLLVEKRYPELQALIASRLGEGGSAIDYLVVADPQGAVLAQVLTPPEFLPGVAAPPAGEIVRGTEPMTLLVTRTIVPIQSGAPPATVANVVGGYYLDGSFAKRLEQTTGAAATVVVDGRVVASTLQAIQGGEQPVSVRIPSEGGTFRFQPAGQDLPARAIPLARGFPVTRAALVISTVDEGIELVEVVNVAMVLLVVLTLAGSAVLGFLLARAIARPLRELGAGANAIAAGNYDQHIRPRSGDEIGQLARAFNEMAERLSAHIAELRESREELKRALTRFGETLRATHDLRKMLDVVLDTSIDTLRAERGVLMLMTTSRDALSPSVVRGVQLEGVEIKLGEGIAGYVAQTGSMVRVPDGPEAPPPSPDEPLFRTALAVPIFSQERVIAVLNLYDKQEGLNFTVADLGTLASLADQAGVAIENVLLHQEAQRLSITDGLTGIWNYRYFRMRYEQEIYRSARFRRPFSLIMCDIDDFKVVNDTQGHQQGDAVLIELARRAKSVIRDIDVLARYGGEEFILILPETDAEGALRTAERIRSVIAGRPFAEEEPIEVTVSAGVACFPVHGEDEASLLTSADLALYQAKATGKNRVILFRPPPEGRASAAGG